MCTCGGYPSQSSSTNLKTPECVELQLRVALGLNETTPTISHFTGANIFRARYYRCGGVDRADVESTPRARSVEGGDTAEGALEASGVLIAVAAGPSLA